MSENFFNSAWVNVTPYSMYLSEGHLVSLDISSQEVKKVAQQQNRRPLTVVGWSNCNTFRIIYVLFLMIPVCAIS